MSLTNQMSKYYPKLPLMWNFLYPFLGVPSLDDPTNKVEQFIANATSSMRTGKNALYLHIPFCETICSFCPFIKSTKYEPVIREYVDALIKEIEIVASSPYVQQMTFEVVFVGGGTPSVLSPELVAKLCAAIHKNFKLAPDYEWTFECEAKTADEERLQAMAEGGANRSSFGVQTLNEKYRKIFNLTASYDEIHRTVELMNRYFPTFNLDLLYQLPGQTVEEAMLDLEQVMALGTTSIDAYPLEYIACAKGWLGKINKGELAPPPSPRDKILFSEMMYQHLRTNGWTQKYVYTFMAPEHSHKRFKYGEVVYGGYEDQCIGLGVGAASYAQGITWVNQGDTKEYIRRIQEGSLAVSRAREYHAYERKLVFFPKTMEISRAYLESLPIGDGMWAKLHKMVERGIVTEVGDTFKLAQEALPWYPALLVDVIADEERPYFDRIVANQQKELGWFEPVELEAR